ncbi:MAG TPA: D-alanine--D-alanine ligase [Patescibacteria group bacterium]|nr:D-alanine--D-alanine ligase [Patescibacteria group bacterium]
MSKTDQHIEIVRSTKRGLSSMSSRSAEPLLEVLRLRYSNVRITIINCLDDLNALIERQPDLVFLGMKFVPKNPALGFHDPNKIWLADYLDLHNISYTGSNHTAHVHELNKHMAKQKVLEAGLNTSNFYVAKCDQPQTWSNMPLSYPIFIKPSNRGGGQGIDSDSVAHNEEQMLKKIGHIATNLNADSLIEEYLPGREFSVAILADSSSTNYFVMPIELIAPKDIHGERILSSQVKMADTESNQEVTDRILRAKINTLAINVFNALGARDYGRIDIRLDSSGVPQFLEANLIPSLINGYGNFPKACMLNKGIGYEQMIFCIIDLAFTRTPNLVINELESDLIPSLLTEPLAI